MAKKAKTPPSVTKAVEEEWDPRSLIVMAGSNSPSFHFEWREPGKKGKHIPEQRRRKRRLIGIPNKSMRNLHTIFKRFLVEAINRMGVGNNNKENYTLRRLPSSTGCVADSNHYINARKHVGRRFSYITDFRDAYPSVDLHRLATLLVFIFKHETYRADYSVRSFAKNELAQYAMETDPLFPHMFTFVQFTFGGMYGKGLAVGGPLSPYLLNLYCEVYVDSAIRSYCEKTKDHEHPEKEIVYSRYVDDLVFSSNTIISSERRRDLRKMIEDGGFTVNHTKSKVLDKTMGAVHITKVGIEQTQDGNVLRFPQNKRRRIEGILKSYLVEPFQGDDPETIHSMIAEFLYYCKQVTPTKSDERTMHLCKRFLKASAPHRKRYKK